MPDKLNRIYQGRVAACQDQLGNVITDFEAMLLAHHQLFQDAVNYYLFALVAMSTENDPLFGRIKQQLKEVWNDFERNGELRDGLKHSMFRIYSRPEILDEDGFSFTETLVLDHCEVEPEILQAALTHIAEKCSGEVTQPSKTYFPQLCTSFNGNYDLDKKAFEQNLGKNRLIEALYSENPVENTKKLIPEMDIGWCGIKTQTGKFFKGEEALETLQEAIQFFIDTPTDYVKENGFVCLTEYLQQIKKLGNVSFGRNNKADMKRRNAMWLLRFFPDEFTVGLMKSIIKEKEKINDLQPSPFGDDPIKLSRGSRGYVFKPFTELPIWQENTAWRNFDMETFMEALKTLNQFRSKSEERSKECQKYREAVEWMEGTSALTKAPAPPDTDSLLEEEENSDGSLPKLADDPRWHQLNNLLHNELAVQNCWTEDEVIAYGLSERTIRSFSSLKKEWNKILSAERQKKTDDNIIAAKLKKVLDRFQSEHSEAMGSAALFQALASPENFCIWAEEVEHKGKYSSSDILQDSVRYNYYKQKISEFEEPIRLTPADARYSRRTNDLLALSKRKEYGHRENNTFIAELAVKNDGKYQPEKVVLNYSAPRLQRDGLCGKGAESFYLPPVLQALFPEESFSQTFNPAVFLMPDWDKDGKLRLLLNFPAELVVNDLHTHFDQRFRGKNEFYYANDTNCALLWPDYKYDKTPTWYKSGEEFYFVSVDLGQRSAGALVRIKVSRFPGKHSVFLGNDGSHDWYAERIYSELLRLPGEDAKVVSHGKFEKEQFGKNGRPAEHAEGIEAVEICRSLKEDEGILFPDGKNIIPHFPVQNDKLLVVFRRAIGKLKLLDRWLWMFETDGETKHLTEELASADWLPCKTFEYVKNLEAELRTILPQILVKIANRILPVRDNTWAWAENHTHRGIRYWQLSLAPSPGNKPKIRGQRGLSFARLTQLEEFRKRCQALNRILMREPGTPPQSIAEMRELVIPDCCPEVLRRLEEMKEQRINQTANMILAQALGVRHKVHTSSLHERTDNGIHGEYETIPGVKPADFIVLENLSRYKFSQDRSPYENSRLMKWSHRALVEKLKMLCEVIGMPILEVNAAYSSKFSAESIPGFRAQECNWLDLENFEKRHKKLSPAVCKLLDAIRENHKKLCAFDPHATSVLPRDGGEIFIPFCGSDDLKQADINAAFNIGLRAVANGKNILVNNRLSAERKKGIWQVKRNSNFAKMIFPEDVKIIYDAENKVQGGNFFVIGCSPEALNLNDAQVPHLAPDSGYSGFLMFGSAIWRNPELQLERCLKLNKGRLKKLTETESLF